MESESNPRRLTALTGAAALLFALVTGCTSADPSGTSAAGKGRPGGAGAPARAANGEIVLPIDAYSFTVPDTGQISRARNFLIRDCMRRFGFRFDLAAYNSLTEQSLKNRVKDFGRYSNKRRYGITSMDFAATYGYHLASMVDGTTVTEPPKGEGKAGGPGGASPAEEMVLSGNAPPGRTASNQVDGQSIPNGGCMGEADNKISGTGRVGDAELVARIARDSFSRSFNDPKVTAAFTKWSDCLEAKGYSYPSPREAGGDFETGTRAVSPKEIAAAKADVTCKQQVHLIDIWSGFESTYQQDQIDEHIQELQKIKSERDAQMRRVADIIAKG